MIFVYTTIFEPVSFTNHHFLIQFDEKAIFEALAAFLAYFLKSNERYWPGMSGHTG